MICTWGNWGNINLLPNGTLLLPNQYTAKKTASVQIVK